MKMKKPTPIDLNAYVLVEVMRHVLTLILRKLRVWRVYRANSPAARTLTVIVAVGLVSACATAQEFLVEGVMNHTMLSVKGEKFSEQEHHFSVSVKNCRLYAKRIPIKSVIAGEAKDLEDYSVFATDLTNFYQLACVSTIQKQKGGSNSFFGLVGPGSVPFGLGDSKDLMLWYTFGSSCYFKDLAEPFIFPPIRSIAAGDYAKDFRVRGSWRLSSKPPFLPEFVSFDSVKKFETKPDGSPMDAAKQFTNCVLSVQAVTNVGPFEVPLQVVADFYYQHPADKQDVRRGAWITFKVTNIVERVNVTNFSVPIDGVATITDLRAIVSETPFAVLTANTRTWPSLETTRARAQAKARRQEKHSMAPARIIQLLIVGVAIVPIAIAGRRAWQNKTKKEKG